MLDDPHTVHTPSSPSWPVLDFTHLGRNSMVPGTICVFGEQASPLITSPAPAYDVIVAAGRLGSGRCVAVSHEGYLSNAVNIENGVRLWQTLVTWAAGESRATALGLHTTDFDSVKPVVQTRDTSASKEAGLHKVIHIGCMGHSQAWLRDRIVESGLQDSMVAVDWKAAPSCDVVVWIGETGSGDVVESTTKIETTPYADLLTFVHRGGGLVVGMCPWGFEQVREIESILF